MADSYGEPTMNDAEFRLPRHVRPERYTIELEPHLEDWTFHGHETIRLQLDRAVRQIALHAVDLEVTEAAARVGRKRVPARVSVQPARETVTLHFAEALPAG